MGKLPWRLLGLGLTLIVALSYNQFLISLIGNLNNQAFTWFWLIGFVPYLIACLFVLRKGSSARGEIALVLVGALLLRAQWIFLPPTLSHDAWRYLWDARITFSGFSPYLYTPIHPALAGLRNVDFFQYIDYRTYPTIYPPAAQGFYLLGYLLTPDRLLGLKLLLVFCEMLSCIVITLLLAKAGYNPAYVLLYAWNPLPIGEFALQGHIDALLICFLLLATLANGLDGRKMRLLTGILLGLATLTKLYPILLVLVFARRKDWFFWSGCLVTIVFAYLPYAILGHGEIWGFLAEYSSETASVNAGPVILTLNWLAGLWGMSREIVQLLNLLFIVGIILFAWLVVWKRKMSPEIGIVILIVAVLAISPHIYPWYTTILLPWLVLAFAVRGRARWARLGLGWCLLVASCSLLQYALMPDWSLYYLIFYLLPMLVLGGLVLGSKLRYPHLSVRGQEVYLKHRRGIRDELSS